MQGLLAAYVDIHKVFDSVNEDALWRMLGLSGVPPILINLISELYSGTESAVRCGGSISDLLPPLPKVKEVMFSPLSVCLSVCLCTGYLKKLWTD